MQAVQISVARGCRGGQRGARPQARWARGPRIHVLPWPLHQVCRWKPVPPSPSQPRHRVHSGDVLHAVAERSPRPHLGRLPPTQGPRGSLVRQRPHRDSKLGSPAHCAVLAPWPSPRVLPSPTAHGWTPHDAQRAAGCIDAQRHRHGGEGKAVRMAGCRGVEEMGTSGCGRR